MKRLFTLFLAAMLIGTFSIGKDAHAFSLSVGSYNFVMEGFSYTNLSDTELRGVLRVSSVQDEATNLNVYTYGQGGDFLNVVFQDLFVAVASDPTTPGSVGYYLGGTVKMFNNTDDSAYLAAIAAGPDASVFAGGAFGSLILDMEFRSNLSTFPHPDYTMRSTVFEELPNLALQTLGYLDVVGGSKQFSFDNNAYLDGTDVRFNGDAKINGPVFFDENQQPWQAFRNNNVAAQTAVVPEPGTMLLLGAGLIGLAGYARARRRK